MLNVQGTEEWHDARSGRFTGSKISNLLGKAGLNATGDTYAFEKAVEIVFGRNEEDDFISFDMQRGIELEPYALSKLKELKELDFQIVEKCGFFPYGDNAGASPDAVVDKDACAEIKCPRPPKFFNLVAKGISAIDKEYLDQMQMEMLCTNSKRCHFFNYIIYNGEPMWHEIIIERDEVRIELIKTRIEEAVVIRDAYVKVLREKLGEFTKTQAAA